MDSAEAARFASVEVPVALGRLALGPLEHRLVTALDDGQIQALVLRGKSNVFCRGMDLDEIEAHGADNGRPWAEATEIFARVLERLVSAPKPTLAVVEGPAVGGGVGLAAACDFVLATESATFSLPEVVLGLAPAMVLSILGDRLGWRTARRWALGANGWDCEAAHAAGLVDEVIPRAQVEARVMRYLRRLGRCHPRGVATVKRLCAELVGLGIAEGIQHGRTVLVGLLDDPETRAGVIAFRDYGWIPAEGKP